MFSHSQNKKIQSHFVHFQLLKYQIHTLCPCLILTFFTVIKANDSQDSHYKTTITHAHTHNHSHFFVNTLTTFWKLRMSLQEWEWNVYLHSDFSHRRRVHWPDKATAFSLSFLHTKLLVGGCTERQTYIAKRKSKEKSRKSIKTKEKYR